MMVCKLYLFVALASVVGLVCGQQQHDTEDSTIILAEPSPTVSSQLVPGQPPTGFSHDELEKVVKYYLAQYQQQQRQKNGFAEEYVAPESPSVVQQQQQPEEFQQQLAPGGSVKQTSGILEAAGMVGAGILGGMIGSQLSGSEDHQHHQQASLYQGGYPYQQGAFPPGSYPGAGYSPYPAGAAGPYPYPSVYPSYVGSNPGYFPGAAYQNRPVGYPQQAFAGEADKMAMQPAAAPVQQPAGLKNKQQQSPKWPVFPAGTAYYHPEQFYSQPSYMMPKESNYYPQGLSFVSPTSSSPDLDYPTIMGAIGSLAAAKNGNPYTPPRPYNILVNRRFMNQLSGGNARRGPLIGYLSKPLSQLPMTRDGMVDQKIVEQSAINDGPFIYLHPEDERH